MTAPDVDAHIQAAKALLTGDGLTAEADDATGLDAPYVVVWDLGDDGEADQSPTSHGDSDLRLQTTAVSNHPRGARDLRDHVRTLMPTLAVTGRSVQVQREQALQVDVDRSVDPPLWSASDRWRIWSTPTN